MDKILDRSTLERYAECPQQGYLKCLYDAVCAYQSGHPPLWYEQKMMDSADPMLLAEMKKYACKGTETSICQTGVAIHGLIEKAFEECEGDLTRVPDWIVSNAPKIRPDIQPEALRAMRHVADMLSDLHVSIIAIEQQVATEMKGITLTCRLDLLAQGTNQSLHVIDWKTGYKRRTPAETADSFQAQFIAYLLWSQPCYKEVNVIHFWYYETRYGTKSYARFVRNEEHPRLPHLTQYAAFESRIANALSLFLTNTQDAWPDEEKCCQCDMVSFCSAAHLNAEQIDKDPKAFIDHLAYLCGKVAAMKKAATAWVKAKGPLVGTKVVFDRKKPSERFTCGFINIKDDTDECETQTNDNG